MGKKVEVISLIKVKEERLLSEYSPILLIAEKLGLKYLVKEGRFITGPAPSLVLLIDKLTKNLKIKTMADLCCGTGALTKIAILNGVEKVLCLDKNLKAARENLKGLKEKIRFLEKDVFKFIPDEKFDLIVIDAPRELGEKVIRKVVPRIKQKCELFVMWHGSCEEEDWNLWVRYRLRKEFKKILEVGIFGDEITCCSSSEKGMKWLKKLVKIW